MRKVMGGVAHVGGVVCLTECSSSGASCYNKQEQKDGTCTFYAASSDCPDGEWLCITGSL